MLVLTRKMGQAIVIDGQIEIEILKIKGSTVRLGIKAPESVRVLRGELQKLETEIELKPGESIGSSLGGDPSVSMKGSPTNV